MHVDVMCLSRWYAFCCSHGGDIVCLDGETGARIWGTSVLGRAESGLVLSADLKVNLSNVMILVSPFHLEQAFTDAVESLFGTALHNM